MSKFLQLIEKKRKKKSNLLFLPKLQERKLDCWFWDQNWDYCKDKTKNKSGGAFEDIKVLNICEAKRSLSWW